MLENRRDWLTTGLAMLLATASAGMAHADEVTEDLVFPSLQGTNLEGQIYDLPGDLEGELNLIIVAFRREQQEDVDTWMPAAAELQEQFPQLRYYELPTMARRYKVMRGVIDGGMRNGIADAEIRARTITLYIDKSVMRSALAIDTEREIQTYLLDGEGKVLWRVAGPFEDAALEELRSVLSSQ